MAQRSRISTGPNDLTSWQIFTNNGRFNSALPPSHRSCQRRITSNADRTGYPNVHYRLGQTPRNRFSSSIKSNAKKSSNIPTTNNRRVNEDDQIRIYLPVSSDPHAAPFSRVDTTDNSATEYDRNISSITRECAICLLDQPINLFEQHYNNECEHFPRTICDTCVYNYIRSVLENVINSSIACSESNCQSRFNFETIRYILKMGNNLELFERFDRQLTHEHLEQIGEFVWCAHNGCGSGQLHDTGSYSNSMVICIKCQNRTCAFHRIKWHVGMTCEEFDQLKTISVDDRTQLWLAKHSKKCPKCQSSIEKLSGCDHMTCKRCQHQFCWQCFADYRKIQSYGLKYHRKHCSHYPIYYGSKEINSTQRPTTCNIL